VFVQRIPTEELQMNFVTIKTLNIQGQSKFIWALSLGILATFSGVHKSASAQTFEGNNNVFETPLGRNNVTEIDGIASSRRDQNFNRLEIQRPGWEFSATSIGNLINVQQDGMNNTVIINAQQINKGSQRAFVGDLSSGN
jgi:holdfast attachment protein HfaA